MKIKDSKLSGLMCVIFLLILWEALSRAGIINPIFMPPVSENLKIFVSFIISLELPLAVLASLHRVFIGYSLAILFGVSLGILMGYYRWIYRLFEPLIELLRPMPSPALIPIAILFLGIGNQMKYFIIAWASFFPILVNTIDGVRSVDRVLIDTARVFKEKKIIRRIILPAASPQIVTGMRISLAISLILVVISEMVAGNSGIGFIILDYQRSFRIKEMFAGIFALALVGYFLNYLFLMLDSKLMRWHRGLTAAKE
jgi:ABC-type nitrate/sulfonate/bicarbonate transport system permease component